MTGTGGGPPETAWSRARRGTGELGLRVLRAGMGAGSADRQYAICLGIVETPMMDRFSGGTTEGRERVIAQDRSGAWTSPEEIAAAVLWQCSNPGAFTTGHAMAVDGGQTVGP